MRLANFQLNPENIKNWNGSAALRLTEAQQEVEEKRRKIKCPCGYDPHSHTSDFFGVQLDEASERKAGKCNSRKQPITSHSRNNLT